MKESQATFNEQTDRVLLPVATSFPAHLVKLERRTMDSGSVVYNPYFKIAPEAVKKTVDYYALNSLKEPERVVDEAGNPLSGPANHMVGRQYRADGVWYNPVTAPGEGWKNRNYKEFLESLQIKLPTKKVKDFDVKVLVELEENDPDILGMPVIIVLSETTFTGNDGAEHKTMKVKGFSQWPNGKRIDVKVEEKEDSKDAALEEAPF